MKFSIGIEKRMKKFNFKIRKIEDKDREWIRKFTLNY